MDFKVHYNKIILEFDKMKLPVGIVVNNKESREKLQDFNNQNKYLVSEMSYEKWKKSYSGIKIDIDIDLISEISYEKWKKSYGGIKIDIDILEEKDPFLKIFSWESYDSYSYIFDQLDFLDFAVSDSDKEYIFTENFSFRKKNGKLHIRIFDRRDHEYDIKTIMTHSIDWDDCVKNKFLQLLVYIKQYQKIIAEHVSFNDYLKKNICANRIQKACHNWLYSPLCKDGSVGLMVKKDLEELNL